MLPPVLMSKWVRLPPQAAANSFSLEGCTQLPATDRQRRRGRRHSAAGSCSGMAGYCSRCGMCSMCSEVRPCICGEEGAAGQGGQQQVGPQWASEAGGRGEQGAEAAAFEAQEPSVEACSPPHACKAVLCALPPAQQPTSVMASQHMSVRWVQPLMSSSTRPCSLPLSLPLPLLPARGAPSGAASSPASTPPAGTAAAPPAPLPPARGGSVLPRWAARWRSPASLMMLCRMLRRRRRGREATCCRAASSAELPSSTRCSREVRRPRCAASAMCTLISRV